MKSSQDPAIVGLLAVLSLDSRGWTVTDNWEADLCAIGIAKKGQPRRLVYVSTFGKKPGRYDYECEDPVSEALDDYVTVDRGKDVDFRTLMEALERHLI
jgi:hypothetical protein